MRTAPVLAAAVGEAAPGLIRIEVPLHGSPLRSINSYVVPSARRTLIVDTGMLRPECEAAWLSGLGALGVDLARADVLLTHIHADHSGLAGVAAELGARMLMGRRELAVLSEFENRGRFLEVMRHMGSSFGLSQDEMALAERSHPGLRNSPESYPPMEPVDDGDSLQAEDLSFQVVHTPGHTPGHICLWEARRGLLLSGDHILGDITPNITAWPGVTDSLGDYLASLEKVDRLDPVLALPGHRSPVHDARGRIHELQRHHSGRLEEVLTLLTDGPHTVCELASRMTWDIRADDWSAFPIAQKWFACGEAASHLDHLQVRGKVRSSGSPPRWETNQ